MPSPQDRGGDAAVSLLATLGRAILATRYVLMVFFFGLAASLALFAARFVVKLGGLAAGLFDKGEEDVLIAVLHLVDSALIASLVMIVVLSSYDSLVDRLAREADQEDLGWVGRTDYSNLKIKVATAMVAISSIHLLQVFLKVEDYSQEGVMWRVVIHALFLVGALMLGLLDRLTRHGEAEQNESV
ncbi:TIGR00645 family protein [Craurococcus roseus]|uniref:UPF0114 protein GCM10009416_15080 n=1 Tax=Craurococcus roseus TaxID=77585 RepID=A0ABN1EY58_9PROT